MASTKLNRKALDAADTKFREVTEAPATRFKVFVTVDTGQHFELPAARTAAEAQAFASNCVVAGWWHGGLWFPPHRLTAIRTEAILRTEPLS